MMGSAAVASMYIASGRADAESENGMFLWDIAAGAAIVKAAGGNVILQNLTSDVRVDATFTNKNF